MPIIVDKYVDVTVGYHGKFATRHDLPIIVDKHVDVMVVEEHVGKVYYFLLIVLPTLIDLKIL